jgi:predicted exporter
MSRSGSARALIAVWLILAVAAAVIVVRANYTADLSAFLPRTPTATQQLLVDQLSEGIASRLILIGIEGGAGPDERARISVEMARRLRASTLFVSVNNGEPVATERDQAVLFDHRYLLSEAVKPARFTVSGLHDAIQGSVDLLASPAGMFVKSLLQRDPTGEMAQIIDQLGDQRQPPSVDGVWASRDGQRALLVAETRTTGSDTDGQEVAVRAVREAFAGAVGSQGLGPARGPTTVGINAAGTSSAGAGSSGSAAATLEMSGPGVFSVAARATIVHEATRLSIISTALIALLLLSVYRSLPALALGLIPVASGALAGIAAVALGFDAVHGITLGFGVTLIGESVDYSIYLFIQSQQHGTASLWPTIRLGVLTSIVGFASLLPSGFPGLAQLGLFSISGLITAALVTRFVLPNLLPPNFRIHDVTSLGTAFARVLRLTRGSSIALLVIPAAAAAILYTHKGSIWNRELGALSPLSEADVALDSKLRSDIGAPDVSSLVVISGATQEGVLRAAEAASGKLEGLVEQGVIAGFESPARYLPSQATQRARQASLPDPAQLKALLATALEGIPIRAEKLEPFLRDAGAARTQPLLTREDLEGTSLSSVVDALLLEDGDRWSAILPLRVPTTVAIDVERVHSAIVESDLGADVEAVVLDVKAETDRLYATYLSTVVRLSLAGVGGIVLLLLLALRSPARVFRVVAPLILAVLAVAAGLVLLNVELTILHLIGMLLIVAVGSNYALFFDRRANAPHAGSVPLTLASLLIANAATVVGFGVLGFSTVPVLSDLGSTVAPGAFLALVFSALLAGKPSATAEA